MNVPFGKRVWFAAALVVGLGAGLANAATPICRDYTKLTLQQVKQNVDRRCGFTGARWSLDIAKHSLWCEDVGPTEWRAELKARDDMLAKCKG